MRVEEGAKPFCLYIALNSALDSALDSARIRFQLYRHFRLHISCARISSKHVPSRLD